VRLKGLFCCLPCDHLYGFVVYGLQEQTLLPSLLSTAAGQQQQQQQQQRVIQRFLTTNYTKETNEIFHVPWIYHDPRLHQKNNNSNNNAQPQPVSPEKKGLHTLAYETKIDQYTAQQLATNQHQTTPSTPSPSPLSRIRFSKHSYLSPLQSHDSYRREEVTQEGIGLVLCRVLMKKQYTVTVEEEQAIIQQAIAAGGVGGVTEEEKIISRAILAGYDSVYFPSQEEYVMLQPANVLPEFLMHVIYPQLTSNNTTNNTSNNNSNSSSSSSSRMISLSPCLHISTPPHTVFDKPCFHLQHLLSPFHSNGIGIGNGDGNNGIEGMLLENMVQYYDCGEVADQEEEEEEEGQRNVRLKQSSLLAIEQTMEEFRIWKRHILQHYVTRMQEISASSSSSSALSS